MEETREKCGNREYGWRRSENWAGHRQVARAMVAVLAGAVRAKLREQRAAEETLSAAG